MVGAVGCYAVVGQQDEAPLWGRMLSVMVIKCNNCVFSPLQSRSPLEIRLKESEEVQKQLEKRILEVEKTKQLEQEERRKALDAVEKQVSLFTHRQINLC